MRSKRGKKGRKKRKWKVPSQHHLPWVSASHPHRRMLAGELGPKVRLVCAVCPYLSPASLANIFTRPSARICSPRSILQPASSPPCPQAPNPAFSQAGPRAEAQCAIHLLIPGSVSCPHQLQLARSRFVFEHSNIQFCPPRPQLAAAH